jgi:hypothetical protein
MKIEKVEVTSISQDGPRNAYTISIRELQEKIKRLRFMGRQKNTEL